MTSYGKMRLNDTDADEMLAAADADGDDAIDYEEFIAMFTDRGVLATKREP